MQVVLIYFCIAMELKTIIEAAWENRALLSETATRNAIDTVIEALDKGQMRVAQPEPDGTGTPARRGRR